MTTATLPARRRNSVDAYLEAVRGSRGSHAYASLLGITEFDPLKLRIRVEKGFAFASLRHLTELMGMTLQDTAEILFISPRTLQRRKTTGRLHADESDRLLRLSRVFGEAIELFDGDREAALRWMNKPLAAFGAVSPLALSKTEPGALEVERLIGRLEHGVFS
jgi:putative toxin-antitoxin system antitoxin component (TIGR02293 family)